MGSLSNPRPVEPGGLPWFRRAHGIRRRWIVNSMGVLVVILTAMVATFLLVLLNYYYSGIISGMETRARAAAGYLTSYTESDYLSAARTYIATFEDSGGIELQYLSPDGSVIYSSNGLTVAGFTPDTEDITRSLETMEMSSWHGVSPQTGEHIAAVSIPLERGGETVGVLRYVTSTRIANREIAGLAVGALLVEAAILTLVYLSNRRFVDSIIEAVSGITGIAQRIADGSYGIQLEKKYNDEIGDLTDAINNMSQQIKQMENMKSEFISSVSHELRTPLTAITGWAETIMEGGARDEADIRKGMGIIASESRRLSGMVEELLEFSRLENGRFTLSIEKMDIKAELEDAVYTYHEFLARDGITVCHHDCPEEFPPIAGDPNRLRQVFCNLLDNAAKHGGSGKRIDTAIYPDGEDVVITVRDYGPGIPEEELPNVKLKFYKGSSNARGSGIGLAVCEEIVTRHNGKLTISNAQDAMGGCLVEVRLPLEN